MSVDLKRSNINKENKIGNINANNGQNITGGKSMTLQTNQKSNKKKNNNVEPGELPKIIINIAELLERFKSYGQLINEGGHLQTTKKFEKRIVPLFVVDKRTSKIYRSTRDTVVKSLDVLRLIHK